MAIRKSYRWTLRRRLQRAAIVLLLASLLLQPGASSSYAAATPWPISPLDQTQTDAQNYPPLGIPAFRWTQIPGVSLYRLEVSQNLAFSPLTFSAITAYTRYTPILAADSAWADGLYYWRVRAEEPRGAFSPPFRFTKAWAASSTPAILSPDPGQVLTFFDAPAFSWTPVTGAAEYRFQIAATPTDFNSPVYQADLLATSHQPTLRLPNQVYAWRVIPLDPGGTEGTPSPVQTFSLAYGTAASAQAPALLEPTDHSHPLFTPTFAWTAVPGAENYTLQVTASPTCDFALAESISTIQTSYTPTTTLSSNVPYCWRVRVEAGEVSGEWSSVLHFQRQWSLTPQLLTPPHQSGPWVHPLYAWTAVPEASYYHIEIALDNQFSQMFDQADTANLYYTPDTYLRSITAMPYYWRVTPYNQAGQPGATSAVFSWTSQTTSAAPALVYPPYFAPPNANLNPYHERATPAPIFIWQRVFNPWPFGDLLASAYRIEVASAPDYGAATVWSHDTEGTAATPTWLNPFAPVTGQDYYWHVCPLDAMGGDCLANPEDSQPWWSQSWLARFDAVLAPPPTSAAAPELLRPEYAQEIVEAMPLFEWLPFQGAERYQIQISRDPGFNPADINTDEEVPIPAYAPAVSLAQRSLGRADYGTYYWHVRACSGATCTDWSPAWRFQIAAQSEWRSLREIGQPVNRLLIGQDPPDASDSNVELTSLYSAQAEALWFFGFEATLAMPDMSYTLLLDLDHQDGSGAALLPATRPYSVTAITAHLPEYAIFIDQISGTVSASNAWLYTWNGQAWNAGQRLSSLGGSLFFEAGYLEIAVPSAMIGMHESAGSLSAILFSIDGAGQLQDSVPSDPQAPGSGLLSRFSAISEHLNLILLPGAGSSDPAAFPFVPPFFWDYSTGGDPTGEDPHPSSPWHGVTLEVHRYPDYSSPVASVTLTSGTPYYAMPSLALPTDLDGDAPYYWRVRPEYWDDGLFSGAWVQGTPFQRRGLRPQNLSVAAEYATPGFRWDMVEGAATYTLQISTDAEFTNLLDQADTPNNRFTPSHSLPDGAIYWRVRANRYGEVTGAWSETATFTLQRPTPSGLEAIPQPGFAGAPTLCWDHLLAPNAEQPLLAAWAYRLEISQDSDFDPLYETVDTHQACYTPVPGYADGAYYWRVAMLDGGGQIGPFSQPQTFQKAYPAPTFLTPSGSTPAPPFFAWGVTPGTAAYYWEISRSPSFWPLEAWATTLNASLTPVAALPENTTYYWRVAAIDRDGMIGPFIQAQIDLHSQVILRTYLPQVSR